jgi:DNA-3-methyladenine glycosylase
MQPSLSAPNKLFNKPVPAFPRLERDFFDRYTVQVARDLLGARLVRQEGNQRISGIITETEAYHGEEDQGCHARAGLTPRTQIMYGNPGHAYVYFTYGMHWMLNFVTGPMGYPAAVLIRALLPVEGVDLVSARRAGRKPEDWTNGPAKICQALAIDGRMNGLDLCAPDASLFIETHLAIPDSSVTISPRVGLNSVPEPWKSMPWRFVVRNFREIG